MNKVVSSDSSLTEANHAIAGANYPVAIRRLKEWVSEVVSLCKPDRVHWCDGSQAEFDRLCSDIVESGMHELRSEPSEIPSFCAVS